MNPANTRRNSFTERTQLNATISNHPVMDIVDKIRETVHAQLADAGINDLSLQAMQFGPELNCGEGMHAEKVCTTDGGGGQSCTWKCVPN